MRLGQAVVMSLAIGLTACGDPARPVAVVMPGQFVGTWLQFAEGGTDRAGFLALGQDTVVVALSGRDRLAGKPVEVQGEAGLGSARVVLDNGMRLYLVSGRSLYQPTGGVVAMASYLDVEFMALEGAAERSTGQVRLWSQEAQLAQQALRALQPSAAKPVATATPAEQADQTLLSTVRAQAPELLVQAERLVRLAASGLPRTALATATAQAVTAGQRATLADLEAASQATDAAAASSLHAAAAARARQNAAFTAAVDTWQAQRG